MASKIEDYGFIGNLRTGALVSPTADIEWLCPPRFDADACFASLLGYDEHGRWAMQRQLGNFPQAFSHLALIMTAYVMDAARQGRDVLSVVRGAAAAVPIH